MSAIRAEYDYILQTWNTQIISDLLSEAIDLEIGIVCENTTINFSELKYGFQLLDSATQIQFYNFPPEGVSLKSIKSGIIETVRLIPLEIEKNYTLSFYVEIDGITIDHNYNFNVPKPPRPYNSWNWDGVKWAPPIPKPILNTERDGRPGVGAFHWDEEKQEWEYFKES